MNKVFFQKSKPVFFELIYSCLVGTLVFFVVHFVSDYFVNWLINHGMVRFTLYEGFAGVCFLIYSIFVCFLYFRIPKLRIIPITFITFVGAFLIASADHYVEYYVNANNGIYTWNIFATHLWDMGKNSFDLNAICIVEFWWFINLLLVGIIAKKCVKMFSIK